MFVDSVEISVASGNGGAGAVSFRREKFVLNGGPDGGDGGDGGSVFFKIDPNCDTLGAFRGRKNYSAKNGAPGGAKNCAGKKGQDLEISLPAGTQIYDADSGELLLDLIEQNIKNSQNKNGSNSVLFLAGGRGGLGNSHFKSATNQRPTYAQKGIKGVQKKLKLELKLIADVGLVGFPNVGKSTIISVLSNARPQISNYEFTTLSPHLGIVESGGDFSRFQSEARGDLASFVMADIPGLILGASLGKGLGHEFLRHIERCRFLLFVLDLGNYRDLKTQYSTLKAELAAFNADLAEREFGICFSKLDVISSEEATQKIEKFCHDCGFNGEFLENALNLNADEIVDEISNLARNLGDFTKNSASNNKASKNPRFIFSISAASNIGLKALRSGLFATLSDIKK